MPSAGESEISSKSVVLPAGTRRIAVVLGARSYDILVGPDVLSSAAELIAEVSPGSRCAIVTDENVAEFYLDPLVEALARSGRFIGKIVVPPGEASKSFARLEPLCEELVRLGVERGDIVVALGGGVIGDLTGFAASIVRRGVRVVQVPTTLLAHVDSSVGGKTGINSSQGKNLFGTFHQPSLVLADTNTVATLPEREFRAGYAEVVKYSLLGDADFFDWLEGHWQDIFRREPEALTMAIEMCCRAKAQIVAADEKEAGSRALLNLGHTFGHALEAWAGYSGRLLHGEAVAIGMAQAFRFSARCGLIGSSQVGRVEDHLENVGLPTTLSHIPADAPPVPEAILQLMGQDKKMSRGRLILILVRDIGEAFICNVVVMFELDAFIAGECRSKTET